MATEENMRLMKMLDDAWNSQEWDTFNKLHNMSIRLKCITNEVLLSLNFLINNNLCKNGKRFSL